MPKELVISAAPHETRVAILEDGQLCEIYIEREKEYALVGSIYKGRVTRVLPGMQSAFVDIGLDSDAFLYVGDFLENLEDYDHVTAAVEGKVERMEQQGGEVFPHNAVENAPAEAPASAPPESAQPPVAESSQPAEPSSQPQRPFGRQDRGQGQGRFGRGRGFDRGRRRRGGRWRRGGHAGDRQQGRDLPQSKYASPFPASHRPYEPPAEEPPADYEPVILPGESLAKYKDRKPAETPRSAEGLPSSLYAVPAPEQPPAASAEPDREREESPAPPPEPALSAGPSAQEDAEAFSEYQALPEEPPRSAPGFLHEHAAAAEVAEEGADLSDEEINSLAEQLAEAREEQESDAEAEHEQHLAAEAAEAESAEISEEVTEDGDAAGEGDETDHEGEMETAAGEEEFPSESSGPVSEAEDAENPPPSEPQEREPHPTSARLSEQHRARFQRPMRRGGRDRGNRRMRHDHRPSPPRRPQLISEMLKAGQEIIVQIAKEPLGKKGARITSHIALPGRFLVYMPTVNHIGVSRRIGSSEERSRLRRLVTESKGTFPGGFIVRTAAEGAPDEEIRSDVEFLGRTWDKIRTQAEPRHAPALLHRDLNLVERILRDNVSNDYTAIWIDSEEDFSKVVDFVSRFQPRLVNRVKLYTKPTPIFEEFGIQQELDRALRPKVWLKSGGYIVINHTEALVAIDVNTGKYVGRGSNRLEDTIVKTNLEAVREIIRQIRLRDLGGIIVLDFIDMEERRNRDKVMSALESALRADRAPSKVLGFNEFGLVAITRKRTKQALERVLGQPCPYCSGSGMVKSVPTICHEIQSEARKMAADLEASSITLRVHPEIAKALKTRESMLVEELEQGTRKSVIIQADPTLHWEQYDIY